MITLKMSTYKFLKAQSRRQCVTNSLKGNTKYWFAYKWGYLQKIRRRVYKNCS